MKTKFIVLAFFVFGLTATTCAQQQATPGVTQTQVKQQKRIKQGAKSGELSKAELKQLQKQQRHINRTKKAAKADGVVTKRERARLKKKQKRASANIHNKKNN